MRVNKTELKGYYDFRIHLPNADPMTWTDEDYIRAFEEIGIEFVVKKEMAEVYVMEGIRKPNLTAQN